MANTNNTKIQLSDECYADLIDNLPTTNVVAATTASTSSRKKELRTLTNEQLAIYNSLDSKSKKIKYLASLNWSTGDIARYMGIIYQFARNVLINASKKKS